MTDLVTFGETMLRLSPPPDKRLETATDFEVRVAGAESNVAVAASRLGTDTTWLSKLPDSPLGRRVVGDLRRHGVEPAVAWSDDGRQGIYYLERGSPPRGTEVIYDREDAAVTTATAKDLPTAVLDGAVAIHTTGITPALSETLANTTSTLLERANEAGVTVSFDVNYRSKLWTPEEAHTTFQTVLPLVDVLVVAERDARQVFGRDGEPEAVGRGLATDYNVETVVITRGREGALACRDGAVHEQPAFDADTVSAIGTGDAFVGGLLARLVAGDDLPTALEYAAATAALKRTLPGDMALVTPAEVERLIDDGATSLSR